MVHVFRRIPLLLLAVFLSACTVTFAPQGGAVAAVSVVSVGTLPAYPGAVELERKENPNKATLKLATYDPAGVVFDYYDRELRARGWELRELEFEKDGDEAEAEYARGGAEAELKVERKKDYVRVELKLKD